MPHSYRRSLRTSFLVFLLCFSVSGHNEIMTTADLPGLGNPAADVRIPYGDDPLQFIDLHLPEGKGPHPVIVFIHGGCWLSDYDISYTGKLMRAFAKNGIAAWNIEYRRVGNKGGGWPGTFDDIAKSTDALLTHADKYNLDLNRVITSGHSAGGHFSLWLAARNNFDQHSRFSPDTALNIKGVLGLAPAPDLAHLHEKAVCGHVIDKLMGGSPEQRPERYAIASASELVPIGIPQLLVIGSHDKAWKEVGERYYQQALATQDKVEIIEATESGHFEMIDPDSSTWPAVLNAAKQLLR